MHAVFTPTKSITLGGHFFLRDAMHLTEFSRRLAHVTERKGTNNVHHSIRWLLCRMLLHIAMSGPVEGDCMMYIFESLH